jgi:hypothetical protein
MTRVRQMAAWGLLISVGAFAPGCRLAPMPGGMFSGLMTNQHDRKIAEHAEKSSFPTPAQVGLGERPSTVGR